MVGTFGNNDEMKTVLLEFLSVLPEEMYCNRKLSVEVLLTNFSDNKAGNMNQREDFLKSSAMRVMALLMDYLKAARKFILCLIFDRSQQRSSG